MGEVYRVFDPRLQREVAIKVIARRIGDDPEALRRFEEEARAAPPALNHPNIATVHDIGEKETFPAERLGRARALREVRHDGAGSRRPGPPTGTLRVIVGDLEPCLGKVWLP